MSRAASDVLRENERDPRPDRLRVVANIMVDARRFFLTRDGSPDWRGRTHAYREWAAEVTSNAGISPDRRSSVQAAIRYHTSAALRDRLDDDELRALGLKTESARELSAKRRERRSEILDVVTGAGPITDAAEILEALAMMEHALRRIDLAGMDPRTRRKARAALRDLSRGIEKTLGV
jgi:hypothetical protein